VDLHRLVRGLNAVLPVEISVRSAQLMPLDFHPTIHALGKEYRYHLCLGSAQIPMHRFYSWHVPLKLDFEKMEEAVQLLLGKRDFSAFSNAPVVRRNPAHEGGVLQIEFFQKEGRLIIALRADRFLYKMVRNLVGALVYAGCGKLDVGAIPSLLESRDRSKGAVTAPARGLFLSEVFYDFSK
jgi:tRNA pseudouridine38-40 synthase